MIMPNQWTAPLSFCQRQTHYPSFVYYCFPKEKSLSPKKTNIHGSYPHDTPSLSKKKEVPPFKQSIRKKEDNSDARQWMGKVRLKHAARELF